MGLIKCPDCQKEISDLAEVCINCGRPIFTKNQQAIDIGSIFSDAHENKLKSKETENEQSNLTTLLFIGVVLFLTFSWAFSGSDSPTKVSKPNLASAPKPFIEEEDALATAIKFTHSHPNSPLSMKITGYKYALQELENVKNKFPNFKINEIASLTAVYLNQKNVLEAELVKQEEESKKQREKEQKEISDKQKKLEARLNRLEKNFRIKKDEVEGNSFLTHKAFPAYTNSRSSIFPYIGKSGNYRWLRVQIQYVSNDWLFVEKLIFSIDGDRTVKEFNHFDWNRDNGSGDIWEWIDFSGDLEMQALLEKIANSKKAILRFEGRQYYKDLTISPTDKKAILETLEYYRAT